MEILGLSSSTPRTSSRIKEIFWPKIEDDVAAATAGRNAMYVCLFIAILTGGGSLLAGQYLGLIDALFFAIAGIGVRQLSRTAAIAAFLLYALSWLGVGGFSVLRPLLLAILLGGIRAAAWAHNRSAGDREQIANPAIDTTGMSKISILLEDLPRRAWPAVHGPFIAVLLLFAALILIVSNSLIFGTLYTIPTPTMEPTVKVGDRIFVLRSAFAGVVRRGDVVAVVYSEQPESVFLKRVVGVPGDRIKIVNKNLVLNGKAVKEPYVEHIVEYLDSYRDNFPSEPPEIGIRYSALEMLRDCVRDGELVVPPGKYFLLGDNRDNSLDSRYLGLVEAKDLKGRPLFRLGKQLGDSQVRYPLGQE